MEQENRQETAGNRQKAEQSTGNALPELETRVAELQALLIARDAEIAGLKQGTEGLESRAQGLERALAEAVAGYLGAVVEANPDIPPELIKGESIQTVADSLKRAKALVGKVRKGLEAEMSRERFPAGAPGRGSGEAELTAGQKIRQGIGRG